MKNSASDVFCLNHATAYQHAFGYIRQLAIHLRNSMKVKAKVIAYHLLLSFVAIIYFRRRKHTKMYTIGNSYTALTSGA